MSHTPFNGDHHIGEYILTLVKRFNIQSAIETGMQSGHTTRELAVIVPHVITIDITAEYLEAEFGASAVDDLKALGIDVRIGDSRDLLRIILKELHISQHPVLFYLDAHLGLEAKGTGNPLLDELSAIGNEKACRDNCVICIHDFDVKVPGLGYDFIDCGRGPEPLSYDIIKGKLPAIFPGGWNYHYNTKAAGAQRGIIFIYPNVIQ